MPCAAAQFGFAVQSTHQFGFAKDGDDLGGMPGDFPKDVIVQPACEWWLME